MYAMRDSASRCTRQVVEGTLCSCFDEEPLSIEKSPTDSTAMACYVDGKHDRGYITKR